jgi:hypothetical protein
LGQKAKDMYPEVASGYMSGLKKVKTCIQR